MLEKIKTATKYYWDLIAVDSIIMSTKMELSPDEFRRIVDTLVDNNKIKAVLVSNSNNNKQFGSPQTLLSRIEK
jgi:hypothetical protein